MQAPMPPDLGGEYKRAETCMFNFMNTLFIFLALFTFVLKVRVESIRRGIRVDA